ncbi:hypothetical protein H7U32_10270, partial [Bifidobacterium pullorum subsp. saeculare]|nr:hypothetical protein [Bifidobacterium pullorum subsp. saeculare]
VDRRADIFAAGIVTWEMLTGRRLFKGDDDVEVLHRLLDMPIPRLRQLVPELPESLERALARALERDRDRRPATAEAFMEALERAAPEVGGLASARTVGAYVEQIAHEKLLIERRRVREVGTPLPTDTPSTPSSFSGTPAEHGTLVTLH